MCKKENLLLVLNDQGGAVMNVSYNVTGTLRAQMGGHPPIVLCFEPRSQDGVPRMVNGDVAPTLNSMRGGQRQPCILLINDEKRLYD